jgi:chromosome segregation ATPase
MKKQVLFFFGLLVSAAVYFSSCENPLATATAAYEALATQGDSLKTELSSIETLFGTVQSKFNEVQGQVAGMTSGAVSTVIASVNTIGSTLAAQNTTISDLKNKFTEFAGFDLAAADAAAITAQVENLTSQYGSIGETLTGVKAALTSSEGELAGLATKVQEMMAAAAAAPADKKKKK